MKILKKGNYWSWLLTDNIQVRQAVAITNTKIPEDFRVQYESLLDDKSYQTQEIALFYLWNNSRAALSLFGEI
jgi:aminopeptidase N